MSAKYIILTYFYKSTLFCEDFVNCIKLQFPLRVHFAKSCKFCPECISQHLAGAKTTDLHRDAEDIVGGGKGNIFVDQGLDGAGDGFYLKAPLAKYDDPDEHAFVFLAAGGPKEGGGAGGYADGMLCNVFYYFI